MSDDETAAGSGAAPDPGTDDDVQVGDDQTEYEGGNLWTSDVALSLADARRLTSRRGATLVMLLGEVGTGKSTLMVEAWTCLLLNGAVGAVRFGGSVTSLAFEERAFDSRLESEGYRPETRRTQEEDDGFLHLRLARQDGKLVELLLPDVTGEHFTRIREGTTLEAELQWTSRVDRFCILVDGDAFARILMIGRSLSHELSGSYMHWASLPQ